MNQELKVGDLCLIVASARVRENIGKTVTLIEFIPIGGSYKNYPVAAEPCWVAQGESILLEDFFDNLYEVKEAGFLQRNLMKISDGDKKLSIEEDTVDLNRYELVKVN